MSGQTLGSLKVSLLLAAAVSLALLGTGSAFAGDGHPGADGADYDWPRYERPELTGIGEGTSEMLTEGSPVELTAPEPQPLSPPDIDVETAIKLATARARWQWGEKVRLGSVTLAYGLDGELHAYDVDFTLDGSTFGDYESVAQDWCEYRAKTRLKRQEEMGANAGNPPPPREIGSRKYGSVTVTATYDAPPFRGTRAGVSNFYASAWVAAKVAAQALGAGAIELKRVIIDGSWARLYEFTDGISTVIVQGHEPWGWYEADELSEVTARARAQKREYLELKANDMGLDSEGLKTATREENRMFALEWLDGAIAPTAEHYIPGYNTWFTPYEWHLGCSPTCGSMVLNYHDEVSSYGRLTNFYGNEYDHVKDEIHCHVSDMAPRMADWMNTNSSGTTMPWNIRPGMEGYANTECGYSFYGGIDCTGTILGWCCEAGQDMIDDDLPFVWSLDFYGGSADHSVAVVGYDTSPEPDEFACYDTWEYGDVIEWQSCKGAIHDGSHLAAHIPDGGTSYNIKLTSHDGHQTYFACGYTGTYRGGWPMTITWDNNGNPAYLVKLYYSLDAGDTWTYIDTTSDDGSYEWTVPCGTESDRVRVRVAQFTAGGSYLSSDGSYGNLAFALSYTPSPPSLTYPPLWATCVERDVTLQWVPTATSGGYEVQIGESCGSGTVYSTPETEMTLSLDPETIYYWRVRAKLCGDWSDWSACKSFETRSSIPRQPGLLLPNDGVACKDTSLVLDWEHLAHAAYYKVQLGTGCGDGRKEIVAGSDTIWGGLNFNTTYHWRVKAFSSCGESEGWTVCRTFTTGPRPPKTPHLTSPTDGAGCQDTCWALDWEDEPSASYYRLQIGTSCGAGTKIDVTGSDTTICNLDWNTVYYWRVRSVGDCGLRSDWSNCRSFMTLLDGIASPDAVYPPGGTACMDTALTLDWVDAQGAASYEVQIDTTCGSTTTYYGMTDSEMPVSGLDKETTYYWRVRAIDGCDVAGKWSRCYTFTTRRTGLPGNDAGKWALHYAGQHSTSNTCISFAPTGCGDFLVDAPPGPGHYDIYVIAADVGVIKETRFGLECDGTMTFYGWTACDSPIEDQSSGWPGCGEDNSLLWATPRCGPYSVIGILDVYVYGNARLGAAIDHRAGYAEWGDDVTPTPNRVQITDEGRFGRIGFGEPGFNPCELLPVEPRGPMAHINSLRQNAPNPFLSSTSIAFSLEQAGNVRLCVYDAMGRLVRVLADEHRKADQYVEHWDGLDRNGRPVPTGTYFYTIEAAGWKASKKMILAR
jgi:hypothetical protein